MEIVGTCIEEDLGSCAEGSVGLIHKMMKAVEDQERREDGKCKLDELVVEGSEGGDQ